MAGFGLSYLIPYNKNTYRVYGQTVGEDEAGNLPSCLSYLAGLEWTNLKIKYPTTINIEAIDTRTYTSKNGNCGANSMYNNNTFDYTNYGYVMGAEIDTQGTSLTLFGKSQLSKKMYIEYSTKVVVINDTGWSAHRLSSKRKSGLINSIGISRVINNINLNGNIHYQDFNLDKANIKNGLGLNLSSSIMF
jgi:hypothetical protein